MKRGRASGKKGILSGRVMVTIVGTAVACALLAAITFNSWNLDTISEDVGESSGVPLALGNDDATPSQTKENDMADDGQEQPSELPGEISEVVDDPENEIVNQTVLTFTDANFELLRSDPDSFVNSTAAISGRVYEIVDQSTASHNLLTLRIHNQAIDSDDSRAAIMFQNAKSPKSAVPAVDVEDCIAVEGTVRGGLKDINSLGEAIRIPIIDSNGIRLIECIDSAVPASVTISSDYSQSYGGITLDVERVQLTEDHLRVKISASNSEAGASVYIRDRESYTEYHGETYQSISHTAALGTFKLDSLIPQNSEVSGYLFFEPVEEHDGEPFTFRVVVEKVGISESTKTVFILKV